MDSSAADQPSWIYMEGSVQQGTVLSPVLFSIFINVLAERIEGQLIKFAENSRLRGIAYTLEARLKIQKHLDRLEHWAQSTKTYISGEKKKVLHLGRKKMPTYRIGNSRLNCSACERDLSVLPFELQLSKKPRFKRPKCPQSQRPAAGRDPPRPGSKAKVAQGALGRALLPAGESARSGTQALEECADLCPISRQMVKE